MLSAEKFSNNFSIPPFFNPIKDGLNVILFLSPPIIFFRQFFAGTIKACRPVSILVQRSYRLSFGFFQFLGLSNSVLQMALRPPFHQVIGFQDLLGGGS